MVSRPLESLLEAPFVRNETVERRYVRACKPKADHLDAVIMQVVPAVSLELLA